MTEQEVIKVKLAILITLVVQLVGAVYFFATTKASLEKDVEFMKERIAIIRTYVLELDKTCVKR